MQTSHRKMVRGEGKDQLNGMSGNGAVCRAVVSEAVKKKIGGCCGQFCRTFVSLTIQQITQSNNSILLCGVYAAATLVRFTELHLCVFKVWKMDRTTSRMA